MKKKNRAVKIRILVGLVLMALALPAAGMLVAKNSDNRNWAAEKKKEEKKKTAGQKCRTGKVSFIECTKNNNQARVWWESDCKKPVIKLVNDSDCKICTEGVVRFSNCVGKGKAEVIWRDKECKETVKTVKWAQCQKHQALKCHIWSGYTDECDNKSVGERCIKAYGGDSITTTCKRQDSKFYPDNSVNCYCEAPVGMCEKTGGTCYDRFDCPAGSERFLMGDGCKSGFQCCKKQCTKEGNVCDLSSEEKGVCKKVTDEDTHRPEIKCMKVVPTTRPLPGGR